METREKHLSMADNLFSILASVAIIVNVAVSYL